MAEAVAASSAFPPVLSPAEFDVDPSDFEPDEECDLQYEPFTSTLVLTDGGVYDNLGLETAWKRYQTILVSDGGNKIQPDPEPAGDWARHSKRVIDIMNDQVISLPTYQEKGTAHTGEFEQISKTTNSKILCACQSKMRFVWPTFRSLSDLESSTAAPKSKIEIVTTWFPRGPIDRSIGRWI